MEIEITHALLWLDAKKVLLCCLWRMKFFFDYGTCVALVGLFDTLCG